MLSLPPPLLPLGGRVCAGLSARPFFAARHEVMLQLMRLATHCRDAWVRRLRTRARMRSPLGDHFSWTTTPAHLRGGLGAAALSSWLGRARPVSQALPDSGPPAARRCTAPPKTLAPPPPLALGPGRPRSPKRPKPDLLTDQGRASSIGSAQPQEGDADPFSPPTTAGNKSRPVPQSAHPDASPPRALSTPRDSASPAPCPTTQPLPPAAEPWAALPDVFSRSSAALSGRAVPRR